MELTKQQVTVINDLANLVNYGSQKVLLATVGGYAGTGKTTTICELRKRLKTRWGSIAFVTFTGKASSVLRKKLENNNALLPNDYCGTIHGLIYSPEAVWDKTLKTFVVVGWKKKDIDALSFYNLIIIDESSMVSKEIYKDLVSYRIPIIAFGDHGQLPPIGDKKFNLMRKPDFELTEIHRQSLNSPIIKLSKFIRKEGYIPMGFYSNDVFKLDWNNPKCKRLWNEKVDYENEDVQILCGFNTTRCNLNNMIREKLKHNEKAPYPGEKIVCLVNNHILKIMNGQIGTIIWVMASENAFIITMNIEGETYECFVSKDCFGQVQYTIYDKSSKRKKMNDEAFSKNFSGVDYFDYGYVISVHKSQGSEWNKIVLFEQRASMWDDDYYAKWLYTAVTRSTGKLFIIDNAWI